MCRADYLKEKTCYVALNFEEELRRPCEVVYQLDYGFNKNLAVDVRFLATSALYALHFYIVTITRH